MQVEEKIEGLNAEREALRAQMKSLLLESRVSGCDVQLESVLLNVRLTRHETISYDENLLRKQLKEKYPTILKPDIKKIRAHLAKIEPLLAPLLDTIGSPSRVLIKEKIESGELHVQDFKNTFQKMEKNTLYVKKLFQRQESTPFF
jgi:uncharacterized protein (UPF0335 family)